MRSLRLTGRLLVLASAVVWLGGAGTATPSPFGGPLQTAVVDPSFSNGAQNGTAFARVHAAGATAVRLIVNLDAIAPGGTTKPPGFDPANPADPAYDWGNIDDQVTKAVAAGLEPILCLFGIPAWARDPAGAGFSRPSSAWFGKFAEGVARRYSGTFGTLPRIRYWHAWNEPNLGPNLEPQRSGTDLISPHWYRRMVNAFAHGVKSVHSNNSVIAGSVAPYAATTGDGIPPLTFMKQFLCVSGMQVRPRPRCLERAVFDIWSVQPYTWGGPTHHATVDGDLALGDLPTMKAVLDQAAAAGRIVSDQQVGFWVTEFSWDTNPPDPRAVEISLQTRWTAQALYVMWQSGVSLVTWFLIRDEPVTSRFQSGIYFAGDTIADDTPKPTLQAFRFPTVAFVESGEIRVWSRTPNGEPGTIVFEQNDGSGVWAPLETIPTDSHGVATGLLPVASTQGHVRARLVSTGETSVPFSLTDVPDQPVDPFG